MATPNQYLPPLLRDEAVAIALKAANDAAPGVEYGARPEHAQEHDFGWVVYAAPRKAIEDNDPKHERPGIGTIVVDRRTRRATLVRSSVHPDLGIKEFQDQWRRRR